MKSGPAARSSAAFDAREATIDSVHQALFSSQVSCRHVVEAFLARIEQHNPSINAVIALDPNALKEADRLDAKLASGKITGMLFGVPVLLKDNFDAVGMPTTAGSLALQDLWPKRDGNVVTALREADAIILGKTNLHEFALEGLTVSSLGGQTRNPYDLTRTPGGSSGGSGAAVAASFCVMATGTDTVNSLRSPASANSLYSFRPTQGLISRQGVMPVSSTQDAVGMIGRSLMDIAVALTVMSRAAEESAGDEIGSAPKHDMALDYRQPLIATTLLQLNELRIGVLESLCDDDTSSETDAVNESMRQILLLLQDEGTTIITIEDTQTFDIPEILSTMDVQAFEISTGMNTYLSSPNVAGNYPSSFSAIFASQTATRTDSVPHFLVLPSQYSHVNMALTCSTETPEYQARKSRIAALTQALHATFHEHNLDAIIYPQQRNLVVPIGSPGQSGRNGVLAAVTGSPVICMPIGFSPPTLTAPIGLPIGMEVLGMPWTESKILQVAKAIDDKSRGRRAPVTGDLNLVAITKGRYESVPKIVPGGLSSVDIKAYPPSRVHHSKVGGAPSDDEARG